MAFEVEQKYAVADHADVGRRLDALGATFVQQTSQVDTYFAHPERDFAKTDEALRIRRVDQQNCITYKGPKIDATTKTRREVELCVTPGDQGARQATELLTALGFSAVAEVSKARSVYRLEHAGGAVEVALDNVEGVGTFVELEIVVGDDDPLEQAQKAITAAAAELHLTQVQRSSYLELLLQQP